MFRPPAAAFPHTPQEPYRIERDSTSSEEDFSDDLGFRALPVLPYRSVRGPDSVTPRRSSVSGEQDIAAIELTSISSSNIPSQWSPDVQHIVCSVTVNERPSSGPPPPYPVSVVDGPPQRPAHSQAAFFHRKSVLHFSSLCFSLFLEGWNDSTVGPLLPSYQEYYHVGFVLVSTLFVANWVGFISGAFANIYFCDRFGFGKALVLGAALQMVAYALQSFAGPYPLMVFASGLSGLGISFQNAHANAYVASTSQGDPSTRFGILHATYGLGALASPLVATSFSHTRHWTFHYLVSTGLSVMNLLILMTVFRFKKQDAVLAEAGIAPAEVGTVDRSKYRQVFGIKTVHFLALFTLVYVGFEVTVGGWIVTFIIRTRDGGANAGYISSGFFGGIAVGRLGLMWLNRLVGERRILFIYAALVIALEATIWAVPSMIENAVAVSLIGVLLGPMYPILLSHAAHVLPAWLLTEAIGWIAGFGVAGSAVFPFLTGLVAFRFGIVSLQPILVTLMGVAIVLWSIVPKAQRMD